MIAIKSSKIYYKGSQSIDQGIMLIDNGIIKAIGTDVELPEDVHVYDFGNKIIIPGLIDAHTHVGVWGDGEGEGNYDGNELTVPVSADVHIKDAINPYQVSFNSAREGGVTTVQILPGSSNAVGGLCSVVKTKGTHLDEMILRETSGLKGATGENVKRCHGQMKQNGGVTRMGIAQLMRQYFKETVIYQKEKSEKPAKPIQLKYESGLMVLNKEIPFRIHAHRHDDIVTAIRICEEFDLNYSIEHCTDGHLIRDFLGERASTVMLGPGLTSAVKLETTDYTDDNPRILAEAGAKVSLITDHPFLNIRYFIHYAAVVHKHGLSLDETLKAITLNPAEALGVSHRVGSLEVGKDADFVVLGGEPFTLAGNIEMTFIDGVKVWDSALQMQ